MPCLTQHRLHWTRARSRDNVMEQKRARQTAEPLRMALRGGVAHPLRMYEQTSVDVPCNTTMCL